MIDLVQDDKDLTIKRIVIVGYASPEGSLAMNERLSEGRAKAPPGLSAKPLSGDSGVALLDPFRR